MVYHNKFITKLVNIYIQSSKPSNFIIPHFGKHNLANLTQNSRATISDLDTHVKM
jgi:hypothetical protein